MNKPLSLAMAFLFAGCAGTSGLRESFAGKESPAGYLHDTRSRITRPVAIGEYRIEKDLPDANEVKREKSLVIPLVVFNSWNHEFDVRLGKQGAGSAWTAFGRKGLEADLKRAGAGADAGAGGDRVEVKIRSLTSSSRYYKNGYFYFFLIVYGFGFGHGAKDITSTLDAEITIVRNGKAQTREYSHVEYATVPRQPDDDDLSQTVVNAMVETLSLCFKDMHESVLGDLAGNKHGWPRSSDFRGRPRIRAIQPSTILHGL
jgi:hypothetical protein